MTADTLMAREEALARAYQLLGERFDDVYPDTRLDTSLRPFHDRPALVLGADRFVAASLGRVGERVLARLPLVGAVTSRSTARTSSQTRALTSRVRCYYDALTAEGPR
jgi:hypothetical protein